MCVLCSVTLPYSVRQGRLLSVELEEQPVHPRNLPVSVPHNFGVRAVHTAMYPTIYLVAR